MQYSQTKELLTPNQQDLRERLREVEVELKHLQKSIASELQHMRAASDRVHTASVDGVTAMNNRLTSQYQRIAILDDFKADILKTISRLEGEIVPLRKLRHDMEISQARLAMMVDIIKYTVPLMIGLIVVIEKLAPGLTKSLGF